MNLPHIVLASRSPRRRELLEMLGVRDLEILPARGEAPFPTELPPGEAAVEVARAKALDVLPLAPAGSLVLASDTVVTLEGRVLGKPRDEEEAFAMLSALSGRRHTVYSALVLLSDKGERCGFEATDVFFRPLREEEIRRYIATGEPMDKAGAYGAQGLASLFIERMEGDFFNVVGLPLCALGKLLADLGYELM